MDVSSPTSDSPRGPTRGKRAAERPPSRRQRKAAARTRPSAAAGPVAASTPSEGVAAATAPAPAEGPAASLLALWVAILLVGVLALAWSATPGLVGDDSALTDPVPPPGWLDSAGSVAVVTALSWLLATRTTGRGLIAAGLALALGVVSVLVGGRVLPTGAAVMTCAVGGVYAVMATVPAITFWRSVREVLIATGISAVTAFAAVGFEPTVAIERFDVAALAVALVLAFSIVYRLGAGLHGLGRRGLIVVALGLGVLIATMAYAELLRRYGAQSFVSSVLDFVDSTSARIGAFPRPLVVLLGIPAIVWGTHVRARRRQGWWVCAFGVAATVPMAAALVSPDSSYLEAGLRAAYSLALGLPLGYLVIRVDLALTGPRGARGRRAEEAGPHRPEPSRFAEL